MDITELVRAKRRCGIYAWVGYIIGSFLIVFAFAMTWLFAIVAPLFAASYSTTRGSRLGAALHSSLVGILLILLVLDNPQGPFISLTRWMAFLLFIGFILSLLGLKAAYTYRKLLPKSRRNEDAPSMTKKISRKPAFFYSAGKRSIVRYSLLGMACLLPAMVPFIVWAFTGLDNIVKWFNGSDLSFWLVLAGYAFLVGPCLTGAYFFYSRAKRAAAASLQEAQARDRRQPILLLRSFQDDLTPISRRLPFTTAQPSDLYAGTWTLEEAVEKTLRGYGPVIAIGRPGEKLPPAGAAREYVPNEAWQDRVKDYLSEAGLVVVIAGKTSGLDWEYRQLAHLKVWNRLVLLFPPVGEEELQVRWSHFQQTTMNAACSKKQDEISQALLATFNQEGSPRFVTCKWREDEDCYRLAIYCGLADMRV